MLDTQAHSIRNKLTWMNLLVSGSALLLACAAFAAYQVATLRDSLVRSLSMQAEIVGSNSVSAVLFSDRNSAQDTLSALKAAPNILSAAIYGRDGKLFAAYSREPGRAPLLPPSIFAGGKEAHWFQDGEIILVRTIVFQGKTVSAVCIRSDLQEINALLKRYAAIAVAVLMISLLVALLVSSVFQKSVSEPLVRLAETARIVSREKKYSVRALARDSKGEVAILFEAFNEMLSQIQERDAALQKAQERLHLALKASGVGTWSRELPGDMIAWDDYVHPLFGLQPGAFSGRRDDYLKLVHPEDRERAAREVDDAVEKDSPYDTEFRVIWPDGTTHYLGARGKVYRGNEGTAFRMAGVCWDITDRKQAEAQRKYTREVEDLYNQAPCGYHSLDSDGRVVRINATELAWLGYSGEEVIGRMRFTDLLTPASAEAFPERFTELKERGSVADCEFEMVRKNGTTMPVVLSTTAVRDAAGNFVMSRVSVFDIAERKRAEQALKYAKEQAEAASRFKDQFMSMMSHELRTPLNAILGFSELLPNERYGPLNDRQLRYVNNIHQGGKHLLRLINDILDLTKIEAGRLEINIETVRVDGVFAEVLDALRPLAEKNSQTLSQALDGEVQVRADLTRFRQVLINLMGNAIKFTPAGGRIELAARRTGAEVRLEVRDNGPGIPPEEKEKIFEAFYRLGHSGSIEGSGLGLAISARLVGLQGGKLALESEPGQGSCFHFSLKAATPIPRILPQSLPEGKIKGGPARVLVVEDDAAAAHLIASNLESAGYESIICQRPDEAVAMATETQPDAISLDVMMKPVNGWEILAKLKGQPSTAQIPVIMVTILNEAGVGALLGADEYLVKPVNKADLQAAMERCLRTRGQRLAPRPVLVVEDDRKTREYIEASLAEKGYEVVAAADGSQARDWVAGSLPELVILDLMLPKVSGFDLLAQWRASPRTADLPVFVLTGKELTAEEQTYLRAHTESLFLKDQSWQQALIHRLGRVLGAPQNGEIREHAV